MKKFAAVAVLLSGLIASAQSAADPVVVQPKLKSSADPDFQHCDAPPMNAPKAFARVGFDLGLDGKPQNLTITQSSNDRCLDASALAAVKKYRFSPKTVDGKPVLTRLVIEIAFWRHD